MLHVGPASIIFNIRDAHLALMICIVDFPTDAKKWGQKIGKKSNAKELQASGLPDHECFYHVFSSAQIRHLCCYLLSTGSPNNFSSDLSSITYSIYL
jgi:hypothetical protein